MSLEKSLSIALFPTFTFLLLVGKWFSLFFVAPLPTFLYLLKIFLQAF